MAVCLRHELKPRGVDVSIVSAGEFAAGTAWLSESSMMEQVEWYTQKPRIAEINVKKSFEGKKYVGFTQRWTKTNIWWGVFWASIAFFGKIHKCGNLKITSHLTGQT